MKITCKIRRFLVNALKEDIGKRDITTETLFEENFPITAKLIAKQDCIIAGTRLFQEVFSILDEKVKCSKILKDGAEVKKGSIVSILKGPLKPILTGERVALNILSHLSGIATFTNAFVRQSGGKFKILDTRKTTPGLRVLEKYAVRVGGGYNHRLNLSEMVLIKDNHINLWSYYRKITRIDAISILTAKVKTIKNIAVEVEVESCDEALAAKNAGADIIMFDNTGASEIKKFLNLCGENRPLIEISGGIDLKDIKKFRNLDIDFVSVGKITHSAPAIDFSLEIIT
ncbi:MAG TPA: carboxylating nicotinate-nucleotide diphosphorylase [bacterium]|nr:carboxylating nicotinate-nucleotide diphosphorylase [bacterium]